MSRDIGIFSLSGNYEPNIKAPLDARTRVTLKSDLTDANAWGTIAAYLYDGLLVSVSGDTEENNGVYRLKNSKAYSDITSWEKIGASELPDNLVTYTDIGDNRKSVMLANHDTISGYGANFDGTDLSKQAFNLIMVSKWNKADIGSSGIQMNLNSPNADVTVNDQYHIMLDKDMANYVAKSDYDELAAQVAELKATVDSLTSALEAQHAQLLAVGEN